MTAMLTRVLVGLVICVAALLGFAPAANAGTRHPAPHVRVIRHQTASVDS